MTNTSSSEENASPAEMPVLIVGGSLVGLSTAMFLASRGIRCEVVERHRGSSSHPRAVGYTQRTLELFDSVGLRGIPEVAPSHQLRRVRVESMAGRWLEETDWTPPSRGQPAKKDTPPLSPHTGAAIAQDRLEPMLRERARDLGATLSLGTQLIRFRDEGDSVTAWLRGPDGVERVVRAQYLVACDGARSAVREALGIERTGIGLLQTMRSVLFRADMAHLQRGVAQFEIVQPGIDAFLTTYGDGRWVLMFKDDVERDDSTLRDAITRALGTPVPIEIITTGRWELSAQIATRFSRGRVFLAGDAAHTLPPTRGGYGANTGIADGYNLAWKLSAVLTGTSDAELLTTYDEERRPVALMRYEQTFARPDYARYADDAMRATPILDPTGIELGELYRSSIVIGAGAELPSARRPDEWRGQPGTRAPYREVRSRDGGQRSTLEFFGRDWILVTGSRAWCDAAGGMEQAVGVAVKPPHLGDAFEESARHLVGQDFGIDGEGASLVRPDGVIAWRSGPEDRASLDVLRGVMRTVAKAGGDRAR